MRFNTAPTQRQDYNYITNRITHSIEAWHLQGETQVFSFTMTRAQHFMRNFLWKEKSRELLVESVLECGTNNCLDAAILIVDKDKTVPPTSI